MANPNDLLVYPFKRITYPGIDNPLYIDDIQACTEGIMAAIAMLADLGPTDFAIISGMELSNDTIPQYSPGYFYLNGVFYYMQGTFLQNNWLVPNVQTSESEPFDDGQVRPIYDFYGALAQANDPDPVNHTLGPEFIGDMNAYRVGNDWLAVSVRSLLATQAALKGAAFLDVGTIAGTVMAGNDPRAPYTALQLDARYAQRINVIEKGTVPGTYVPVNAGDPVNKAYSDNTSGRRLVSGVTPLGDADTGPGTSHTIALGLTLPSNVYIVTFSVVSLSANPNIDIFHQVTVRNQTTTSFDTFWREAQAGVQNVNLAWIVWAL